MRTGQLGLLRDAVPDRVDGRWSSARSSSSSAAHRRVTVQYAKRVVGRRMYGGSSTHIPLKVNTGGVIPVIFASSILAFPATIAHDVPERPWVAGDRRPARRTGMPLYNLLYVVGIIFFCVLLHGDHLQSGSTSAENMRKYGGFIPGIRPGQADGGVHRHDPDAHHAGRRALPGAGRASCRSS